MAPLLHSPVSSRVLHGQTLKQPGHAAIGSACLDLDLLGAFAVRGICHSRERISWGLTVSLPRRAPETVAATDDVSVRAGWLQQELQQGPDLAQVGSQLLVSSDLASDPRWPDFGRMCAAVLGLRSMVSLDVPTPDARATMSFFAAEPAAFEHFDVDAALRLAQTAGAATAVQVRDVLALQAELPGGGFSKVAVALGIVMAQYRLGSADGFALLREAAHLLDSSLFRLAVEVVRQGKLPEAAGTGLGNDRFDVLVPALAGAQKPNRHVGCPEMWRTPPPMPTHPPVRVGQSGSTDRYTA